MLNYVNFIYNDIMMFLKKIQIAYTFDAGPHAVVFVHKQVLPEVFSIFYELLVKDDKKLNKNAFDYLHSSHKSLDELFKVYPYLECFKDDKLDMAEFMFKTQVRNFLFSY